MKGGYVDTVLDYEGLIYSIISKYPNRFDKEDLFQAGMLGLVDAYKHYDPHANTKFSTYAYYYIVGEVNKYIKECSSLKIGKDLIELKKKIIKVTDLMTQKLGRIPSNLEIALYLDVPEQDINEALISTDEVSSIEESFNYLESNDNINIDLLDLKMEINKLPKEEREIIISRYFTGLTQSETSNKLGISQVQVSRNEAKILKKLRTNL